MSGVKGRSGRRPLSEEMLRHRTILRAWELTSQKLHSEDKENINIAKDIVLKDMVSKEQVNSNIELISKQEEDILSKYISPNRLSSKQ